MAQKPVHALVGADAYLQTQKLSAILRELPKDTQRIDVEGETAELADVLDELRSFAMFGGGKVLVVRNADAFISRFREQMENYMAAPADSATLVLRMASLPKNQRIYKLIQKVGQIEECEPPKDLSRWIISQAKSVHRLEVPMDVAKQIEDLIGGDMGRLDNELAKLALQVDEGKVTPEDVAKSTSFQREQEIKEMTGELAIGRQVDALRRWRQLMQSDPSAEFRAVTWIGMWLEDVRTILATGSAGQMAWKYKNNLDQFIRTAKAMGKTGHKAAIDLLADIDRQSKSGVGDAETNVERFILSLQPANAK